MSSDRKEIKRRSMIRSKKQYIKKSMDILEDIENMTDSDKMFLSEWYDFDYEYLKNATIKDKPTDFTEQLFVILYFFSRKERLYTAVFLGG